MPCLFKGQGFIGLLVGLTQLKGPEARGRLLPALNTELRTLVERNAIIASGWYPLSWYSEITTAIRAEYGDGIGLEIGRLGMRHDVNAFARFILGLASPLMLLKLSGHLMRLYFQGAALTVAQTGPQQGELRFSQLEGSCAGTWDAIGGAVTAFVELSGGKAVATTIAEGGGSEAHCRFVVNWTSTTSS